MKIDEMNLQGDVVGVWISGDQPDCDTHVLRENGCMVIGANTKDTVPYGGTPMALCLSKERAFFQHYCEKEKKIVQTEVSAKYVYDKIHAMLTGIKTEKAS